MADAVDSVEGVIREMHNAGFDEPVTVLKEWLHENVEYLLGLKEDPYATLERIERRFKAQSEVLRMVEEGILDKNLQYKITPVILPTEEASDVRN